MIEMGNNKHDESVFTLSDSFQSLDRSPHSLSDVSQQSINESSIDEFFLNGGASTSSHVSKENSADGDSGNNVDDSARGGDVTMIAGNILERVEGEQEQQGTEESPRLFRSILKRRLTPAPPPSRSPSDINPRIVTFNIPLVTGSRIITPPPSKRCYKPRQKLVYDELSTNGKDGDDSVPNIKEPICPELLNCTDGLHMILHHLSASTRTHGLSRLLTSRKILTVGDLSALTEAEVAILPIKMPKVSAVRKALFAHLESIKTPEEQPDVPVDSESSSSKDTLEVDDQSEMEQLPTPADQPKDELDESTYFDTQTSAMDIPQVEPVASGLEVNDEKEEKAAQLATTTAAADDGPMIYAEQLEDVDESIYLESSSMMDKLDISKVVPVPFSAEVDDQREGLEEAQVPTETETAHLNTSSKADADEREQEEALLTTITMNPEPEAKLDRHDVDFCSEAFCSAAVTDTIVDSCTSSAMDTSSMLQEQCSISVEILDFDAQTQTEDQLTMNPTTSDLFDYVDRCSSYMVSRGIGHLTPGDLTSVLQRMNNLILSAWISSAKNHPH